MRTTNKKKKYIRFIAGDLVKTGGGGGGAERFLKCEKGSCTCMILSRMKAFYSKQYRYKCILPCSVRDPALPVGLKN
jgi:hypothetical protein